VLAGVGPGLGGHRWVARMTTTLEKLDQHSARSTRQDRQAPAAVALPRSQVVHRFGPPATCKVTLWRHYLLVTAVETATQLNG
jgi:hypothetical protein